MLNLEYSNFELKKPMTSIKVKFRASTIAEREGTIYYQVIHNRVIRQIKTDYKIFKEEWNSNSSTVVMPIYNSNRVTYLENITHNIKLDLNRLSQLIIFKNKKFIEYTADTIVQAFEVQKGGVTLSCYMQKIIIRLYELRKFRTAETYQTTLNSFMRFRCGESLLLTDVTPNLIMDYEAYLKANGLTMNSISFYMRILRAVFNRGVEDEIVEQTFPFKKVYTGIDKTIKRALHLKDIKKIKELDLYLKPDLMFARDIFMFSFYTRGMSFVDIAYLKKRDLSNGILTYRRRKTGQQLTIKWERCMQEIVNNYPPNNTEYLLPIIKDKDKESRIQYRSMLCLLNTKLRRIGEMIGLTIPLTQYVSRHSWASVAKSRNIPISVISEGMGHDSETTTQIYLASLDTSIVDKANGLILKLL